MATLTVWILLLCSVLTGQGSNAQVGCGVAPLNTRIVGGGNATPGSWPWQVSMHVNSGRLPICGGTLISDQWVLTAAHCIIVNSTRAWTLYLGRDTQAGPNVNEVNRTVSQVIIHPEYNNSFLNNDIALMKLSSPVNFTNYIRPVCLASNISQFYNSTLCWATGWGDLGKDVPLPDSSPLQEVQVPVVGNNECACSYTVDTIANVTANMICAGQENRGVCQGDSGGPLQCQQNSLWIQAGIASFGIPCATRGFPEVYARVSQFTAWITEQVAGANVTFVTFTSSGIDPDSNFVCTSSGNTAKLTTAFVAILMRLLLQHVLAP